MCSVFAGLLACVPYDLEAPQLDALRQPTGLALSPDGRRLFITGGNWDGRETGGTLMVLDIEAVHGALRGPHGAPDAATTSDRPCRWVERVGGTIECDPSVFIDETQTRTLGSALGNIAVDIPRGEDGPMRLLVIQRSPAAIAWLDVSPRNDYQVDCGQAETDRCGASHAVVRSEDDALGLPPDPSRVMVDDGGFRFAYVPHLREGALSLLSLDGERGPELTTVVTNFFQEDPFGLALSGGFAVAARPCDPADPPVESRDCTRPILYATHRFWPGTRTFTVAPGLHLILGGRNQRLEPIGADAVDSRPVMGSLVFEEPRRGNSLLVVQTTPGALARVDTSLREGISADAVVATVALCSNPNLLAVAPGRGREPLALVTCYGEGRLAVVSLTTFTLIASVKVGAGANEIIVDEARQQAYIANTQEHSISLVHLDPAHPGYLREWARIGLGAGVREPGS